MMNLKLVKCCVEIYASGVYVACLYECVHEYVCALQFFFFPLYVIFACGYSLSPVSGYVAKNTGRRMPANLLQNEVYYFFLQSINWNKIKFSNL